MDRMLHERWPSVDVLVVNFNSGRVLKDSLPFILQTDYPVSQLRFIVVDNGSTDGSADFVEEYWNVTLLRERKNHGFGAALRASLPYVTAKYVAFLNEDIKPERDWLLNLVRVMEQHPEVGIAGAVMRDAKHSLYDGYYYSPWLAFAGSMKGSRRKESVKNVPYVGLGSSLVRTECLRSVTISKFYFLYCEDIDFTFKLLSSGSSAVVVSGAILHHIHQASIRRNFTEFRAAYYLWRNNLWIPIIFYDRLDLMTAIVPALAFRLLFAARRRKQIAAAIFASLLELPARLPFLLRQRKRTRNRWRIELKLNSEISDEDPFMSNRTLRALAAGASRFRRIRQ